MSSIEQLKSQVSTCKSQLSNMQKTAAYLSNSISTIKTMLETQKNCYVIDDISGGSNTLSYLLEKENVIYSDILNGAIPSIKSKIAELNRKIDQLVAEEAEKKKQELLKAQEEATNNAKRGFLS